MVNKIVCRLSIRQANVIYKFFKVGFIFHNGQGSPFIDV